MRLHSKFRLAKPSSALMAPPIPLGTLKTGYSNPNIRGSANPDQFGFVIAQNNRWLAVSAKEVSALGEADSWLVYVYDTTTGTLVYTLDNPSVYGTAAGDKFGTALAIYGDYLAVSATWEGTSSDSEVNSGVVYLFSLTDGNLLRVFNNTDSDGSPSGDIFGGSVALWEDYLAVGAYGEDYSSQLSSGLVYLYSTSTGDLLRVISNPNAQGTTRADDNFGTTLAASDGLLAVGAPGDAYRGVSNSGSVYIFDLATGARKASIINPNGYGTTSGDSFGSSLALCGSYLAVGAYQEDDASGGSSSGRVYLFNATTGGYLRSFVANAYGTTDGDQFGYSVALSTTHLVIGAPRENSSVALKEAGRAFVYSVGGTWPLVATLSNPGSVPAGDQFGISCSLSDHSLCVGAHLAEASDGVTVNSGRVYEFYLGQ